MLLLLDHENVLPAKRNPASLFVPWLGHLRDAGVLSSDPVLSITTRVYGGWYSGVGVAPARYEATNFYADGWPAILRFPPRQLVRSSLEFADYLLSRQGTPVPEGPKITNTFVIRAVPPRLGLTDRFKECSEPKCERRALRKWLGKEKGCFNEACPHSFADCFVRKEQKQVDMHIAVDLLEACVETVALDHVALATDDTDFVPVLLWALQRKRSSLSSLTLLRSTGNRPLYCESDLRGQGCEVLSY